MIQINETRFKLCRSRLAKQSWWFRVLFEAQQAGSIEALDIEFESDKEDIQSTLDSLKTVDGCDLFTLKLFVSADADDMAALLDAMEDAISYMNNPPPVPKLAKIYVAASSFGFSSYREHVAKSLMQKFSDDPARITQSLIADASSAVKLGGSSGYSELEALARCAYYQIARRPIQNGIDPLEDDPSLLEFDQSEVMSLLKVQRRLVVSWDVIERIVEPKCPETKHCGKPQPRSRNPVPSLRKNNIFDPIWSINKLLQQDWVSKGFCEYHANLINENLGKERNNIWDDMRLMVL